MAVASSPKCNIISEEQKIQEINNSCPKPSKRTKDPGVRVRGGRVYDSTNGNTCHQCRQKTMDIVANCKNQKANKPCSLKFCRKCLLNRYGEKAEEVDLLEDWTCPKCKGSCNCSNCMKKRGHQPTGALIQTAKAVGFASVSELLQAKGPENFVHNKLVKDVGASAQSPTPLEKEMPVTSPRKRGKENLFDGKIDINTNAVATNTVEQKPVKKPKKLKREELKVTQIGDGGDGVLLKCSTPRKLQIPNKTDDQENKDSEIKDSMERNFDGSECTKGQQDGGLDKMIIDSVVCYEADQLPEGTELAMVAGAELAPEDVGDALQLLEFCATFGKIINLTKGQPEAVLRELTSARSGRRGKYSTSVQFLTQLLSILRSDSGEISPTASSMSDSWLNDLKEVISDSQCAIDPMLLDKLNDGYETLNLSQKLKIFNFLCDEILGTEKIRNWIDVQNARFVEEEKELKEKLYAAKDKEKQMKQKMLDEIKKATNAENSTALPNTEHGTIISEIKSEAAQAHAEMLQIKDMISDRGQKSDAIRTHSVFVDDNGCAFWKFKCYSNGKSVIRQDVGSGYIVSSGEKWYTYDEEQQNEIEKYISLRSRKTRRHRVKRELPIKCSESSAEMLCN